MVVTNLDIIVRRHLLERNLPIHYYAEVLYHASAALRELSFDSLQIVNTKNLPVNNYNAVDLPDDFVDDVLVAVPAGGMLQPVPKRDGINPIRIHNIESGSFVPYADTSNTSVQTFFGFTGNWSWFWNVNDWGEPTGRFFGSSGGAKQNGYKVVRERRQLQMTGTFTSTDIILMYISDGQNVDAASQIDTRAQRAIQTYCDWQMSPAATMKDSPQASTFYNERRLLRARLNDLTPTDIKNTLRNNYIATNKT